MTSTHANPFVLPGFGQTGEFAANPVMASMEMMRKAWQSLAEQGGLGAPSIAVPLSEQELTQRITDLRAVENWLRMNLTVLSSTIQGLEVQRATLATLKNFVNHAAASTGQDASGADNVSGTQATDKTQTGQTPPLFDSGQAVAATQAWWDLLRQQFDSLATATAASMPSESSTTTTARANTATKSTRKSAASRHGARKSSTPASSTASAARSRR